MISGAGLKANPQVDGLAGRLELRLLVKRRNAGEMGLRIPPCWERVPEGSYRRELVFGALKEGQDSR